MTELTIIIICKRNGWKQVGCVKYFGFIIFGLISVATFANDASMEPKSLLKIQKDLKGALNDIQTSINFLNVKIRSKTFLETNLEEFDQLLNYTSALDPIEGVVDIPKELESVNLTTELQKSFSLITTMISKSPSLYLTAEWKDYKSLVDTFLAQRLESRFRLSRSVLKTGAYKLKLQGLLQKITEISSSLNSTDTFFVRNLSVEKAIDQLKRINKNLDTLKNPSVAEKGSGDAFVLFGLVGLFAFVGCYFILRQKRMGSPSDEFDSGKAFDYSSWFEKFESSLQQLSDQLLIEGDQKKMMLVALDQLREARVGLQLANNQTDYEQNLLKLNHSSAVIEEYYLDHTQLLYGQYQNVFLLAMHLSNAIGEKQKIIINNINTKETNTKVGDIKIAA